MWLVAEHLLSEMSQRSAQSFRLSNPVSLFADSLGQLFIAGTGLHRILKVDASGILSFYAGTYRYATSTDVKTPSGACGD